MSDLKHINSSENSNPNPFFLNLCVFMPKQLYKVSDASGDVETTLISNKPPFKQSSLDSGDVFLISNTAAGQIFVWKG